jgi:hypothetical protein
MQTEQALEAKKVIGNDWKALKAKVGTWNNLALEIFFLKQEKPGMPGYFTESAPEFLQKHSGAMFVMEPHRRRWRREYMGLSQHRVDAVKTTLIAKGFTRRDYDKGICVNGTRLRAMLQPEGRRTGGGIIILDEGVA